ncbi:hypothetical protein ACHAXR_005415 [Thalassiosira sp. AJA248-18]
MLTSPTAETVSPSSSHDNARPCPDTGILRETCLDPEGPQPYILVTLGRSGSGSTWQVIGNLTGYEMPSHEYTGGGPAKTEEFFQKIGGDDDRWLLRYLCSKQLIFPEAGVVGFKWKPFDTIFSPPAQAAFRRMASLKRPEIKVVRSRRNLLDVVISKYKHSVYKDRVAAAHCIKGGSDCIGKGIKASTGLELPPTDTLLDALQEYDTLENKVDVLLKKMKIPHVQVTYERLYYNGNDTSEWRKIFKFLGVGPVNAKDLTRHHLEGAMEHVATSIPMQNVTLKNFDAVSKILKGTKFEKLLH